MTVLSEFAADLMAYGIGGDLSVSIDYTPEGGAEKTVAAVPRSNPAARAF
jgi:hypothetical protein